MNIHEDEIHILLAKYFANEADAAEEQQVYAWIEQSEENLRHFEGYMQLWEQSRQMPHLEIDENKAWKRFKNDFISKPVIDIRKSGQPKLWIRIAAAAVFLLVGAWLTYLVFSGTPTVSISLAATATAQTYTLPDRSVVTLNKHANLSYTDQPGKKERSVTLQGEAFFNVTADKEKPFVITAGQATIRVVGTSFNVKANDDNTAVIVNSGIVQVTKNGETIELTAGERITVTPDITLQKSKQEDLLYNYYVSKTFICDNTPLWKLVEKLNEAYGVNITISNKELSSLPLSVTFSEEGLETILDILGETLMITITKEGNTIDIK